MKAKGEIVFNLIILVILATFVILAFGFSPKARMLPLIVGIPAVVLMVIQIILDFVKKSKGPKEQTEEEKKRQWSMFGGVVGLLAAIMIVGLSLGVSVYLLLFIRLVGRQKWWIAVLACCFAFALSYGLFGMALHYPMYKGLLGLI